MTYVLVNVDERPLYVTVTTARTVVPDGGNPLVGHVIVSCVAFERFPLIR
jgi:hypothetical protein